MRRAIAAALLIAGVSISQCARAQRTESKPSCSSVLKILLTQSPYTEDETQDGITVCAEGRLLAFHSVKVPPFGNLPTEKRSEFEGKLDKQGLADLRRVLQRGDIVQLAKEKEVNMKSLDESAAGMLRFSTFEAGKEQQVTLRGFLYLTCEEEAEVSRPVRDLLCLFRDLYSRARAGWSPKNSCECKSLHEMAESNGS